MVAKYHSKRKIANFLRHIKILHPIFENYSCRINNYLYKFLELQRDFINLSYYILGIATQCK